MAQTETQAPVAKNPLDELENNWETIRHELQQFLKKGRDEEFAPKYAHGWSVLGVYVKDENLVESGKNARQTKKHIEILKRNEAIVRQQLERNQPYFPETLRIVESLPGIRRAGFSRMKGHTYLAPHKAPFHPFLRCHLGLLVPEPRSCGLNANGNLTRWTEGKCFLFDETIVHEAWNYGEEDRIVLIIDVERDPFLDAIKQSGSQDALLASDNAPLMGRVGIRMRFLYHKVVGKIKKLLRGRR